MPEEDEEDDFGYKDVVEAISSSDASSASGNSDSVGSVEVDQTQEDLEYLKEGARPETEEEHWDLWLGGDQVWRHVWKRALHWVLSGSSKARGRQANFR